MAIISATTVDYSILEKTDIGSSQSIAHKRWHLEFPGLSTKIVTSAWIVCQIRRFHLRQLWSEVGFILVCSAELEKDVWGSWCNQALLHPAAKSKNKFPWVTGLIVISRAHYMWFALWQWYGESLIWSDCIALGKMEVKVESGVLPSLPALSLQWMCFHIFCLWICSKGTPLPSILPCPFLMCFQI